MTKGEIMVQILAEASGKPVEETKNIVNFTAKLLDGRHRYNDELTAAEAQELLARFRADLPGIRRWLDQGAQVARREWGLS